MVGDGAFVSLRRKPGGDESDFIQLWRETFEANGSVIAAGDFNIHVSDRVENPIEIESKILVKSIVRRFEREFIRFQLFFDRILIRLQLIRNGF